MGQAATGVLFGAGQTVTGKIVIGQVAFGKYVLAQIGFGEHVWSMNRSDPEAIAFFRALLSLKPFQPLQRLTREKKCPGLFEGQRHSPETFHLDFYYLKKA